MRIATQDPRANPTTDGSTTVARSNGRTVARAVAVTDSGTIPHADGTAHAGTAHARADVCRVSAAR